MTRDDVVNAIIILAFTAFFIWFILGSPGLERFEQHEPHAVEGREEWVDAREGTTYSLDGPRLDC